MIRGKCICIILVLSLVASSVLCQTFQYSRGWTNGKRSELPNSGEAFNSISDESFTNGELGKLKMLMHGNVDEQPLLIRCNVVDKLRRLVHNFASPAHREKGQNDDNY